MTAEELDRLFDINVKEIFLEYKYLVVQMKERGYGK